MPRGCCLLAVAAQLVWAEPEEAEGPVSVETLGTETPPVSQSVTEPVSHHLKPSSYSFICASAESRNFTRLNCDTII